LTKQITVAICTYNRPLLLGQLLESIVNQTLDPNVFQVLVVDNYPNKHVLDEVKIRFKGRDNIIFTRSFPPGLSTARNHALKICESKYIAYIDDDALPDKGWLRALLKTFETTASAVIGGPIKPIWSTGIPDWIPKKYADCLTILDYGPQDRALDEWSFLYGTNMAFDVNVVRKVGGFHEALGRRGKVSLLSDEEIELQKNLQSSGYSRHYSAQALVNHRVHEDRLRQSYFRSRMAWQAVLDTQQGSDATADLRTFLVLARAVGQESLASIFVEHDADRLELNIDFIRALQRALLSQHLLTDAQIQAEMESFFAKNSAVGANTLCIEEYLYSDVIFFEHGQGHSFLFSGLSMNMNASLFEIPNRPFEDYIETRNFEIILGNSSAKKIFFLTLDPLAWGWPGEEQLPMLMDKFPQHEYFGIVHRVFDFDKPGVLENLFKKFNRIFCYSKVVQADLRKYGVRAKLLHIHAVYEEFLSKVSASSVHQYKSELGLTDRTVFSLVGELRAGKGYEFFLAALRRMPKKAFKEIAFIFAGRTALDVAEMFDFLDERGARYLNMLVPREQSPDDYRAVSDLEFALAFLMSDCGLYLYHGDQTPVSSASAPNFVALNKKIIATENSEIGRLTDEYDLGWTVKYPEELASVMAAGRRLNFRPSARFQRYKKMISLEAASSTLSSNLF